MKKNNSRIIRYLLILRKLTGNKKYVDADTLIEYLNNEMGFRGIEEQVRSQRTLQRDFNEIEDMLGIKIKYRRDMGYFISERDIDWQKRYDELVLNFDLLTALNKEAKAMGYIIPEHHRPKGSENIPLLLKAIKENTEIYFDYYNIRHDNATSSQVVKPYFLKESLGLWYLIAVNGEGQLRTFGVDRMDNIHFLNKEFVRDTNIDADKLFKDCFGIWDDPCCPVEEVELVYSELDGRFLKNNPLHHSQTIINDTKSEFRIKLNIKITNDFVMALLSRSKSLEVVRPKHLRDRVKDIYLQALKRNQ